MKKKTLSRRDFLKLSATGVGVMMVPNVVASTLADSSEDETTKIPERALGRTGIKVPILSMGVMRADNPAVLRGAYNSGIFYFDTAHGYQNGRNEEMVGSFFTDKPRESFFVATKIKSRFPLQDDFEDDLNEKMDVSLKRLQMDYVDILYTHALENSEQVKNPRVIAALTKLKESGKARFLGFSTHAHKPEMIDAAVEAGIYDVILTSYNFKLNNLPQTDAAIERAAKAGIGIVAMKTMTGGVEDAEGKKKIDAKACLKWVWQNPNVATIIPGFTNFEQLDECLEAVADPKLTVPEERYLASLRNEEMLFCQQCNECLGQCPSGLPIPDIMRAYMYTYGYKFASLSKETLAEIEFNQSACSGCETCSVNCPSGFNVADKIAAVIPVMNVPDQFLA